MAKSLSASDWLGWGLRGKVGEGWDSRVGNGAENREGIIATCPASPQPSFWQCGPDSCTEAGWTQLESFLKYPWV